MALLRSKHASAIPAGPRRRAAAAAACAFVALVSALGGPAPAQTYTLTGPDGPTTRPLLPGGGEALEVRLRNGALPDAWGSTWWTAGQPIVFDTWEVDAPGKTILGGALVGARETAPGHFLLAAPSDYKVPAKRNNIEIWPGTETHHRIFPGDTLYARLVPADDPFEIRYLAKDVTAERRQAALAVMAFDEARIARWPWLQKVLSWYRFDRSSQNVGTPPGSRNVGWMLVPRNFLKRWPNYAGGVPAIAHWYGFGTRSAAPGENLVNEHYGSDAAWIGQGLRASDPTAVAIGLALLRNKIAYGLIDCDDTTNWMWGKWRNEKGNQARGTTGMRPSPAKEFDKGLAMASVLLPADPMIARATKIRQAYLLGSPPSWHGRGGSRNLGHFLENLRHWYVATGDARFRARAATEIAHAMEIIGTPPYFIDDAKTHLVSAGEGVCALAALRWWALHEAGAQYQKKLDEMLAWYVANCLDAQGNPAYFVDVSKTPPAGTFKGTFQGCNWLQIPGLPDDARARIERAMFTKYAMAKDCDVTFGGEGPGWEKWIPWIVCWGACSE